MPFAYMISRIIKVDFTNKSNPLIKLGVLFSINQILYLLIAMWIFPTVPEKMVMVLAIIFGAHLMPYGWLYKSKCYLALSIIIPIVVLVVGIKYPPYIVAGLMVMFEVVFSLLLIFEVKRINKKVVLL